MYGNRRQRGMCRNGYRKRIARDWDGWSSVDHGNGVEGEDKERDRETHGVDIAKSEISVNETDIAVAVVCSIDHQVNADICTISYQPSVRSVAFDDDVTVAVLYLGTSGELGVAVLHHNCTGASALRENRKGNWPPVDDLLPPNRIERGRRSASVCWRRELTTVRICSRRRGRVSRPTKEVVRRALKRITRQARTTASVYVLIGHRTTCRIITIEDNLMLRAPNRVKNSTIAFARNYKYAAILIFRLSRICAHCPTDKLIACARIAIAI